MCREILGNGSALPVSHKYDSQLAVTGEDLDSNDDRMAGSKLDCETATSTPPTVDRHAADRLGARQHLTAPVHRR